MGRGLSLRALRALVIALTVLSCCATAAWADDDDPVPPPPPPDATGDTADADAGDDPADDGDAAGTDDAALVPADDPSANPAPDVRPRPNPPPPPGAAMPDWDVDHLGRGLLPPPLPKPMPFDLRDIRFRHDVTRVSAAGVIMPVKRIPQWVDVIEREDLAEWRPKNIGFLAERYPNVVVGDLGNPFLQVPGIRGMGGDRIKILTDGVWPGAQALGSQGGSLSLWDPESTERVEIYHGPGAYLRAIDSPGGFINIVPRRPRQHGPFSVDTRGSLSMDSAQRRYRGRAEIDVGEDRIGLLTGVTWTSNGDRVTGDGDLGPSEYDQLAADFALDYFLGPNATLGFTVQYMEAQSIESPINTGSASQPGYDRLFLGVTLASRSPGEVMQGTRISFAIDSIVQEDDLTIQDESAGIGNSDVVARYDFSVRGPLELFCCHNTWATLNFSYGFLEREETLLCVDIGEDGQIPDDPAELALQKIIHPGGTHADLGNCEPVTRKFEAEELFISGLLTDTVHSGCYDVYMGVRGDFFHVADAQNGDANRDDFLLSAAVGTALHLTKRTSVYGNLSYGSRRPTLFELGAIEIVNGNPVFGNPELEAEQHGNAEIGVKTSFKNRWSLQAAVFTHYIDETIAPTVLLGGADAGGLLENQGQVWIYGFELTGAWRPFRTFEGLEFWGSLGITEVTDDSLAADIPLKAIAAARYSVPSPKGYVVRRWYTELLFRGALDSKRGSAGGAEYVTGDFIVGGQVDIGKGRWAELNLGVTNIFDVDYTPAGALFKAPGMALFVGLGFDV